MSRAAGVDDVEVFRVLETQRRRSSPHGGISWTVAHGPFRTLSAAKALVTRARQDHARKVSWRGDAYPEPSFVIERAATAWEEVPAP